MVGVEDILNFMVGDRLFDFGLVMARDACSPYLLNSFHNWDGYFRRGLENYVNKTTRSPSMASGSIEAISGIHQFKNLIAEAVRIMELEKDIVVNRPKQSSILRMALAEYVSAGGSFLRLKSLVL